MRAILYGTHRFERQAFDQVRACLDLAMVARLLEEKPIYPSKRERDVDRA
jgi:hypothetical protein